MTWSDETLMAFADGELDAAQSALLQATLHNDLAMQQRIAVLLHQRQRLAAAFEGILDEPLPDRLTQLLRAPQTTPNDRPRTAKPEHPTSTLRKLASAFPTRVRQIFATPSGTWGALAASVMFGVVIGTQWASTGGSSGGGSGSSTGLAMQDGRLRADGPVAAALASQLASDTGASTTVAVQLSFVDQTGHYCRTFTTAVVAGLACLQDDHWRIQQLSTPGKPAAGEVRQAATALPLAVLDAVDQRIAGTPLSTSAEQAARARGWRP